MKLLDKAGDAVHSHIKTMNAFERLICAGEHDLGELKDELRATRRGRQKAIENYRIHQDTHRKLAGSAGS